MPVAEPQKELRFTRTAQATLFCVVAAVAIMAGIVFFLLIPYRKEFPDLPHPAWGWLPILAGAGLLRLAYHCVKHAYLILTPLGIEIFPFFRPAAGMQLVAWAQITGAEAEGSRLTLHFNEEKTSGIHLSLGPIPAARRDLVTKAVLGRVAAH
jgi:hypothetical protein